MGLIFQLVASLLSWISEITGLSYEAINIIVYYIIVPFIFLLLVDKLIKKHYFKIGFSIIVLVSLLIIKDFESFSRHLFNISVQFLKWFDIIGWNYTVASVIICVILPFVAFIVLVYYIYKEKIRSFADKHL
jgi:hypothetical protein